MGKPLWKKWKNDDGITLFHILHRFFHKNFCETYLCVLVYIIKFD